MSYQSTIRRQYRDNAYAFSERRYCSGKQCYDKKGALTVKNNAIKLRKRSARAFLRIYECHKRDAKGSTHWHVTSH